MKETISFSSRFRGAREAAGLSVDDVAARAGISSPCVWDLETLDEELFACYSAADLRRFAAVLGVTPAQLLNVGPGDGAISADELSEMIQKHCRSRGITLAAFGDAAGWDIGDLADGPKTLMTGLSLEGVRDVCRELDTDWRRFVRGL